MDPIGFNPLSITRSCGPLSELGRSRGSCRRRLFNQQEHPANQPINRLLLAMAKSTRLGHQIRVKCFLPHSQLQYFQCFWPKDSSGFDISTLSHSFNHVQLHSLCLNIPNMGCFWLWCHCHHCHPFSQSSRLLLAFAGQQLSAQSGIA